MIFPGRSDAQKWAACMKSLPRANEFKELIECLRAMERDVEVFDARFVEAAHMLRTCTGSLRVFVRECQRQAKLAESETPTMSRWRAYDHVVDVAMDQGLAASEAAEAIRKILGPR